MTPDRHQLDQAGTLQSDVLDRADSSPESNTAWHEAFLQYIRENVGEVQTVGRGHFLPHFFIIKPTRCTNSTNLFWHETLHVSRQNKFVKLVHLVGFIIKKFVTMQHGHTSVKFLPHVGFVIHNYYTSLHYSTLAIKDADK